MLRNKENDAAGRGVNHHRWHFQFETFDRSSDLCLRNRGLVQIGTKDLYHKTIELQSSTLNCPACFYIAHMPYISLIIVLIRGVHPSGKFGRNSGIKNDRGKYGKLWNTHRKSTGFLPRDTRLSC